MTTAAATYFRRCPSCGTQNTPDILRCNCGALLAGVDLSLDTGTVDEPAPKQTTANVACPFEDCGQSNPIGTERCLYCDRPLSQQKPVGLFTLPSALSNRYRITETMPTRGAEADLFLVQAISGGATLVGKIYRHGITPKTAVQERIAQINKAHRIDLIEFGASDGYAYELMEYCAGGSLRPLLGKIIPPTEVRAMVQELASALADIHTNGIVHRDLKPENILIRTRDPLNLVLIDFSIASLVDVTQRYTSVAHTLPYAPPESLSGVIDAKADYWALGMIILEAATGQHPFSGLSDAVILHYLTTRNIVTTGIKDAPLAKLVRGLLQRDPKQRWGDAELTRWLAGDTTLAEPSSELSQTYNQPYHLGGERYFQADQLGVALAHHWEMGATDIANGQLLSWFREVQKDQNVVRLLLDVRSDPKMSINVQLLKLILSLAPGIPPVWLGQSIALPAILAQANSALKGDDKAAQWLHELYQYRVLKIYADAGNQSVSEIAQHWYGTCDQFLEAWESKRDIVENKHEQNKEVDIDQLMYGGEESSGKLSRPHLSNMHAHILASCYGKNWVERKRQQIMAELTRLSINCPWFADLGNPLTMSNVDLLITDSLLPAARNIAEKQTQQNIQNQQHMKEDCESRFKRISGLIGQLRTMISNNSALTTEEPLRELCEEYFNEINEIRTSGRVDEPWTEMRRYALKHERKVQTLLQTLNKLSEHTAITQGWLNQRTAGFAAVLFFIFLIPSRRTNASLASTNPKAFIAFLGAAALFAAWRFMPVYLWTRKIKDIGRIL